VVVQKPNQKDKGRITMEKEINKRRTKTEVYTRVVGYLRPVDSMNSGKQEEVADRKMFKLE